MEDFQCLKKEQLHTYNFNKWPTSLLHEIRKVIGKPYKFNCFDTSGFDCYTLIYYLYSCIGIKLPKENIAKFSLKQHVKLIQKHSLLFKKVDFEDRQPFDILIFETKDGINAHLGLVLDKFNFIHTTEEKPVVIEPFLGNYETTTIRAVYRWNS